MSAPSLIIAGVVLPVQSRLQVVQTIEPIGGDSWERMSNGSLVVMSGWQRWKTTINGSGWVPPQLLGINYSQPYQVHSVAPIALAIGAPMPPGWVARTDWPEKTFIDRNGVSVRLVYPILTVMSRSPKLSMGANPSWSLECEEP